MQKDEPKWLYDDFFYLISCGYETAGNSIALLKKKKN